MSLLFSWNKNKKNGFSLIEVMLTTGVMTIVGVSLMGISQLATQDSLQVRATRVALTARAQIEAALKNPASWRQTVFQNTSFTCVNTSPGCNLSSSNGGYYDFVLYGLGAGEKITFDASETKTRYSIQGGPCPAGTANPDRQCPIKFVARWKPLCQTYPCLNPTLDIKVSLVPEFGTNAPPINPAKYAYETVRGVDDGSLQSACQILNGTYNVATGTCYPKNAGRSCVALGKPAQIVSSVAADGSITCTPLYTGQCNAATEVMSNISALATAQCAAKVQPPNCPAPCVGGWGGCSTACGGGTQTYTVTTPAINGGPACPFANGTTTACNTQPCPPVPTDCVGNFGACSQSCGGGTMTYSITTPASNGGAACAFASGTSQVCNTQACVSPIDCVGGWGACSAPCDGGTQSYFISTAAANGGAACAFTNGTNRACNTQACPAVVDCAGTWGPCSAACGGGTQTYSISTAATNSGAACPAANGASRACNAQSCPPSPVNCVGAWSACSQSCGGGTMTYAVTTPASNGGAICPNNAGDNQVCNSQACAVPVDCAGSWSACNPITGTKTFTITQTPQNGGAACPAPLTQTCPVDCVGSWGECSGGPPQYKTYTWTTPPLNGGSSATCAYPNGQTDQTGCGGCTLNLPLGWDNGGSPVTQCRSWPLTIRTVTLSNGQTHWEQGSGNMPSCGEITIKCVNGVLTTTSKQCNPGYCE